MDFQYPVEIPGVSVSNFVKAAINEHRKINQLKPITSTDLLKLMKSILKYLEPKPMKIAVLIDFGIRIQPAQQRIYNVFLHYVLRMY